jgi:PAS domain S-box-containing protein
MHDSSGLPAEAIPALSRPERAGPSELARLIRSKDWSATPLGAMEDWPPSLKFCVDLILAAGFPMAVRWGPDQIMIYNDAYVSILGDKHPRALGAPLKDVWPEIYDELGPLSQDILRGDRRNFFARNHLWRIKRHGDVWEDARFTIGYSPIHDETSPTGVGGVLVTAVETTLDIHAGERLRDHAMTLQQEVTQRTRERDRIWHVSEDLLGVSNFEGYFVSVNPAWTALLGWSEEEIKRMHVSELRHPDDAPAAEAGRARLASGITTVRMENRFRHRDGSWRWLYWTMTAEAGLIYVIGRHVTAERQAEERLRESERQFRLLVGAVTDYALFRLTPDGLVSTWNVGAERIKGYAAQEIIGQHYSRFYTEEDRRAGLPTRALAHASKEGRFETEGWRVRKDGTRFWASVVMDAIYDETGELVGLVKITRDITERREAQLALQRTQEQLAQAQKMDALGQLTGGIAHDFNNLLMVVGGYTQFLKRRLNDPKDKRALDAIELAANRAESLTRQLLTFSRRQPLNPTTVDLAACFATFRDVLETTAKGNIKLDIDIPDGLWPVTTDVSEFEVAIINLVVNARDAMPNGGMVVISMRNEVLDQKDGVDRKQGEFVAVEVRDTGVGIAPEVLPQVFDPFFTTKEIDRGTGLGLSQVYGFVHQAGGTIKLSSAIGRGTTVTLYLPRSRQAASPMHDYPRGETPRGGKEIILLVEDNVDVQSVAATMLEQLGYTVITADSASQALAMLDSQAHVDLVFTDIVMPGPMNGVELARRVMERHPGMSILLTTGYAKAASEATTGFPVLRKPYQLPGLAEAIQGALKTRAR